MVPREFALGYLILTPPGGRRPPKERQSMCSLPLGNDPLDVSSALLCADRRHPDQRHHNYRGTTVTAPH